MVIDMGAEGTQWSWNTLSQRACGKRWGHYWKMAKKLEHWRTVVLEKISESPLDSKEIKPVNLKGNQPWMFIGRTDAEAEAPILWPPDTRSRFIGNDPDAGKDWRQKEKRVAEAEMVGWHHRFNGHELGQTSADSEGQGGLACCSPWGHKRVKHDWATEQQHIHLILYIISFRLPW